jgi:hypothetical protein
MPIIFIKKSNRPSKKWVVILPVDKYPDIFFKKTVHFGDSKMQDYTLHKDELRKSRYISRTIHQPIFNVNSPAFWSRNLLWNKKTLNESIKDIEKRFGFKIRFLD